MNMDSFGEFRATDQNDFFVYFSSIPFRKIKDRGREVLFYAAKLEPPFWDDKEDSVFNFVKEITLSMG